jgi:glutaredoxin-like YruB-family protein
MQSSPKIVVFSTPSCSWCKKAKTYLRDQGYRFRDVDISRDQKAAQDLQRRTGAMSVPVILVNNRPVIGFNQRELDRLLQRYI